MTRELLQSRRWIAVVTTIAAVLIACTTWTTASRAGSHRDDVNSQHEQGALRDICENRDFTALLHVLSKASGEQARDVAFRAAALNWAEGVQICIEHGVRPNERLANSLSILHIAASADASETISLLIKNGADIDITDNRGMSPLMHACKRHNAKSVFLLAGIGSDMMCVDDLGQTALHWALRPVAGAAESSATTLAALFSNTSEEQWKHVCLRRNHSGQVPLVYAAYSRESVAIPYVGREMEPWLCRDAFGRLPIHYLFAGSCMQISREFACSVSKGVDECDAASIVLLSHISQIDIKCVLITIWADLSPKIWTMLRRVYVDYPPTLAQSDCEVDTLRHDSGLIHSAFGNLPAADGSW